MDPYPQLQAVYFEWKEKLLKKSYRLVLFHMDYDNKCLKFKAVDCLGRFKNSRMDMSIIQKELENDVNNRTFFNSVILEYQKGNCCG